MKDGGGAELSKTEVTFYYINYNVLQLWRGDGPPNPTYEITIHTITYNRTYIYVQYFAVIYLLATSHIMITVVIARVHNTFNF